MPKAAQTAIERYKARRQGRVTDAAATPALSGSRRVSFRRVLAASTALLAAGAAVLLLVPWATPPIQLTYRIDLEEAARGTLSLTVELDGRLPRNLLLAFPPGAGGAMEPDILPHTPTAHAVDEDGAPGRSLPLAPDPDGWRLRTGGARRVAVTYRVDVSRIHGGETDIRRHISTLVNGGVRAAGFEIFLVPVGLPVADITVALRNPRDLPVIVPWPSLVRGRHHRPAHLDSTRTAHLGSGQSFLPAGTPPRKRAPVAAPADTTTSQFFHPRSLSDLSNALLICGDLRTAVTRARDCEIQYATDRRWLFADDEALDLVRRIARTELGFFGSAPSPRITVLLAANEVTADDGFDVYGVHTGSSVLVMIDGETTWGELEAQAASVIAHEMFHGWLGEAVPQEDPTTLWFTEGATTWFAARMLTAAGIWSAEHARDVLAGRLRRDYELSPLKGKLSVAAAAADVMGDQELVRYAYAGGVAACASLDAWLSRQARMERPLDGVLRHLYDRRDGTPLSRAALEEAIRDVTGVDCTDWLEWHVYGKSALPVPDRLI